MSLVLIPVKVTVRRANGTAVQNATVRAVLTVSESDDGLVVPGSVTGVSNVSGEVTLNLWPNSRGLNGSQYRIEITASDLFFSGLVTIPEAPNTSWPISLETLINQPPYPSQSTAERAQAKAQEFMVEAKGARDQTIVLRDEALVAVGGSATGTVGFATYSQLTLAYADKTVAIVVNDSDPTKNTWYVKSGASGAGTWVPGASLVLAAITLSSLTIGSVTLSAPSLTGYLRAVVDSYGRLAWAIKNDGTNYVDKLLARQVTGEAATITALTVASLLMGPIAGAVQTWDKKLRAVTDTYGRMSYWEQDDGSVGISKLRDGSGALVYPVITAAKTAADAALIAASTGGASAFRQAMLAARAAFGQHPKPSMATPPTLTLTGGSPAAPAGTTLIAWNAIGKWRTTGGVTPQFDANPFLRFYSRRANGNGGGYTSAGSVSIEAVHTGDRLIAYLRGNGQQVRVLVGDANGRNLAYVSTTVTSIAGDGAGYQLDINFSGVSASRTIVIEGTGNTQFGGFYVPTGQSITAPTQAKPLICGAGTSITERDTSWTRWLAYRMGADIWSTGVGGSGVMPQVAGTTRFNQLQRSLDLTDQPFVLGIDENGINDTDPMWYSGSSYATVVREFGDEYRKVLDAWFTAHPNSPWIAWNFWPGDNTGVANVFRVRDAKERVCSEYPLAAFIDTHEPRLFSGSPVTGTYPGKDYFEPYVAGVSDITHPIEDGSDRIAAFLDSRIDLLIRTRF